MIIATVFLFPKSGNKQSVVYKEGEVSRQNLSSYYSYDGYIEAGKSQSVYAKTVGTIQSIPVTMGQMVEEGDLLVSYDNNSSASLAQAQASLSSTQLSYNTAKTNSSRMAELYAIGAISTEEYESAQNSVSSAQIQLSSAQTSYSAAAESAAEENIYAKFVGMVVYINADEGDDVNSGTEVMKVISYDDLEINISIDEYDMASLSEGQKATVTVNSTGEVVQGEVSQLSRQATVTNGVSYFSGVISVEPSQSLSVGVSVEVTINISDAKNVLCVPVGCIQYDENDATYVFDKNMEAQYVELGISTALYVEILSGLNEGDIVMEAIISSDSTNADGSDFSFPRPGMDGGNQKTPQDNEAQQVPQ